MKVGSMIPRILKVNRSIVKLMNQGNDSDLDIALKKQSKIVSEMAKILDGVGIFILKDDFLCQFQDESGLISGKEIRKWVDGLNDDFLIK